MYKYKVSNIQNEYFHDIIKLFKGYQNGQSFFMKVLEGPPWPSG